jgi:hypothetical protein
MQQRGSKIFTLVFYPNAHQIGVKYLRVNFTPLGHVGKILTFAAGKILTWRN